MSHLKNAVRQWHPAHFDISDDPPKLTVKAAIFVDSCLAGAELKTPSIFALDECYQILKQAFSEKGHFDSTNRRILRHAPWVIFAPRNGEAPLADNNDFGKAFLQRLAELGSGILITSLLQGFLMFYPSDPKTREKFCTAISSLLFKCEMPRCRRWRECSEKLHLLELDGASHTWNWYANQKGTFEQRLQNSCLTGMLHASTFMEAVFHEAVSSIKRGLAQTDFNTEQFYSLMTMAIEDRSGQSKLRFRSAKNQKLLAEGLLMPFQGGTNYPEFQEIIKNALLEHFGDPRLDRSRWQGVSEDALSVMMGWLVTVTLEDFFRVMERLAKGDEVATRHWKYRKAFWTAYLKKGVIQGAWVALGPSLDRRTEEMLKQENKSYGRLLRGPGTLANHTALIMKIDSLVITEWSHNGSYRLWNEGTANAKAAPKFYKATYYREDLIKNPNLEGSHSGAENGRWQDSVADYIRKNTGIQIRKGHYMP